MKAEDKEKLLQAMEEEIENMIKKKFLKEYHAHMFLHTRKSYMLYGLTEEKSNPPAKSTDMDH
eukprot:8928497-Ditylum_brightwellii.AAC.1